MLLLSLLIIFVGLLIMCWLISAEGDNWLMIEAKLMVFAIATFALFILYRQNFPYIPSYTAIIPIYATVLAGLFILLNHMPFLGRLISGAIFSLTKNRVPRISETERLVIDSGDMAWERDLFYGYYTAKTPAQVPAKNLPKEEQGFLDNEVDELCRIASPKAIREHKGLPPAAFDYIKEKKFWGMIIPKKYGGLEFSAACQAAVITKLSSRSPALAVMVMVPNSLGPGELIMHYGTQAQKDKYLKPLARGEEIPCFALTSEKAGSDAGGLEDYGILTKKYIDGREVLGFNLNFSKRYISLAPIATTIGLAFRAYDPDGLLAEKNKADAEQHPPKDNEKAAKPAKPGKSDLGITCALLPRNTPGIKIGRRHNPLDVLFHNGPISGTDVFVPLDNIIGGKDYIGKGWQMLMDCLSIGRGISLPSLANSSSQVSTFSGAAYAYLREQFGLPIARFEAIGENLGKLAINSYIIQSLGENASALVDHDLKPAVSSAMAKYYTTTRARDSVNYAMDIHGGKAIMKGENNYMEELYRSVPIAITVEGANILTRGMIIFGQGFLRCHPYLRSEVEAIAKGDKKKFHHALWEHYRHIQKVKCRAFVAYWTGGWSNNFTMGPLGKHHRRLTILSAQFAYLVELAVLFIGGDLKRKEAISGRFADAWMAMQAAAAVIRKYGNDGMPKHLNPLVTASLQELENEAQKSLLGILDNFPGGPLLRGLVKLVRIMFFTLGNNYKPPHDKELLQLADSMADVEWVSKNLAPRLYFGTGEPAAQAEPANQYSDLYGDRVVQEPAAPEQNPLALLRDIHSMAQELAPIRKKIKASGIEKAAYESIEEYTAKLVKKEKLTAAEKDVWLKYKKAAQKIIAVDHFAEL